MNNTLNLIGICISGNNVYYSYQNSNNQTFDIIAIAGDFFDRLSHSLKASITINMTLDADYPIIPTECVSLPEVTNFINA